MNQFKLRTSQTKRKSDCLTEEQLNDMIPFYLMLVKMKKNRPFFNIAFVMSKTYTEPKYQKFILQYVLIIKS